MLRLGEEESQHQALRVLMPFERADQTRHCRAGGNDGAPEGLSSAALTRIPEFSDKTAVAALYGAEGHTGIQSRAPFECRYSRLKRIARLPFLLTHDVSSPCFYSFETVVPPKFVTQMLAPSKAGLAGSVPTLKVPMVAPVLSFSLVTVAPLKSVTQMLPPS
jgi:hypothetical protein